MDLIIPERNIGDPIWDINGNYFSATVLTRRPSIPYEIFYRVPIDPSQLASEPVLVRTVNGWILITMLRTLYMTEGSFNEEMISSMRLNVPDISSNLNEDRIRRATSIHPVNRSQMLVIQDAVSNQGTMSRLAIVRPGPIVSLSGNVPELIPEVSHEFNNSYETLVKQLYGIPVALPEYLNVNGLRVNFISFQEVQNIQIERYIIDPMLQPWAGLPNSQNKILTIFGKNGMTYLVKVRYDSVSNQIFPPI